MKVTIQAAQALFIALGFGTANKWNAERLSEKFTKMAKIIDKPDELNPDIITDATARKTFDAVAKALRKGEAVEIVEADEPETPAEKAPAAKPAAKPAKPAPTAKPAPAAKPVKQPAKPAPAKAEKAPATKPAGKDRWGSRLGTSAAKINAAIGKRPKTTEDIVAETGVLKATVQERLWKLRAIDKVIDKNEKGWFVKA